MKKITLIALMLFTALGYAQVGINTNNPDASSALEIESTTGGILIPRLTETQRDAITEPATGLMIYQTNQTTGFYFYDGAVWTKINGVAGPQGEAGSQGIQGIQGDIGLTGAPGPSGANGADGSAGVQGAQGEAGSQGDIGLTGATGPSGANGADGSAGVQGPQGEAGSQGIQGTQGDIGLTGATGPSGANGANGATGSAGVQGAQGEAGLQGIQGVQGADATSPTYSIGDIVNGGVVFWLDSTGQHGLVAAFSDVATSVEWGCLSTDLPNVSNVPYNGGVPTGSGAEIGDGFNNTNDILQDCPTAPAALAARSLGTQWFLPSAKELNQMYVNKTTLEGVSGFTAFSSYYWSSTEYGFDNAWRQYFLNGVQFDPSKSTTNYVRAVRAF